MGLRIMERSDIPAVFHLLNRYLNRFDLVPVFHSEDEIEWWLLPRENIVTTYVVEVTGGGGGRGREGGEDGGREVRGGGREGGRERGGR